MLRHLIIGSGLAVAAAAVATAPAVAQDYKARLDGFFEVGALPALNKYYYPANLYRAHRCHPYQRDWQAQTRCRSKQRQLFPDLFGPDLGRAAGAPAFR